MDSDYLYLNKLYSLLAKIYTVIIGLGFLVSLISFRRRFPKHLRFFSILLGITFAVEFFCVFLFKRLGFSSNHQVYNIFMLFEFCAYGLYYLYILTIPWGRILIRVFLVLFPVFWFYSVFYVFGLNNWNSHISVMGSLFTVAISAAYYYQLFTQQTLVKLHRHPEFWIATGMILFYASNLSYVGILNYLNENYKQLARELLVVLQVLVSVMYLIFLYAYVCQITKISIRKS